MFTTGRLVYEMYRGQGQDSWTLRPNIVRKLSNPNQAEAIEKQLVTDFNTELTKKGFSESLQGSFLNSAFHTEWLLLQQSQHYRVPTRFMDWTIDWEVALFFAVSNAADDDYDGQFWIYIVPPGNLTIDESNSKYLDFDPFTFDRTIFLNSSGYLGEGYLDKIAERRKSRQNGRFCIQPYDKIFTPLEEQDEHKSHLTKIIIPKELKKIIREELAELNYTNESLYVNEDGAMNTIVKDLRQRYNV
ncbi:MAG: FRG domain-containing protein [Janthinobacterium lividum]